MERRRDLGLAVQIDRLHESSSAVSNDQRSVLQLAAQPLERQRGAGRTGAHQCLLTGRTERAWHRVQCKRFRLEVQSVPLRPEKRDGDDVRSPVLLEMHPRLA